MIRPASRSAVPSACVTIASTIRQGTVSGGSGESDFEEPLGRVASMLCKHREFLRELIASGGEIEVTVNFDLDVEILPPPAGGGEPKSKVFEIALYPDFIAAVASVPAALRLHLWR